MLKRFAKPALIGATSLAALFTAATASADYHVTAFGYTDGYSALVNMDPASALNILDTRADLDYAEANNLCVAKILSEDLVGAVASCELALDQVTRTLELTASKKKVAMASIYSNLGVAKALAGDLDAATVDLEKALELNARDDNAQSNFESINTKQPLGIAAAN